MTTTTPGRPWRRAAVWLVILAVFFYATYGFANWLASQRSDVGHVVFGWERHVPFVDWTIFPYWSINAFYGLSLFVCRTETELKVHVRRLLTAQVIAVACFLLFPLTFTFTKPETSGLAGFMFESLGAFDKPFNQAPSLHIALTVILLEFYVRHAAPAWRWVLRAWFIGIGVSVLTTYQHHFIDIPTGALLGFFALWLWPLERPSPLSGATLSADPKRRRLAAIYSVGAVLCGAIGFGLGGGWLWFLWGTVALAMVAAFYALFGAEGFQKGSDGQLSLAAHALLLPYLAGAWLNSRLWTRRQPEPDHVADGVWIGRVPSTRDAAAQPIRAILDLSAELSAPRGVATYRSCPTLDLVPLQPALLQRAADTIETLRRDGPVLVTCALGYGRSAAAIAAWLVRSGRAADTTEALAMIRSARPRITLDTAALARSLGDAVAPAPQAARGAP
ncbi:phosphatase PAP2/dual specificity phosphatase family protein [Reyranella sp. CPCC 100927]|uniref:phosphatase PAP2/dual specificity phosphatase family protein n=1 Tax=Reyranella sp. CPCC 100927 TaxID=2599616 RepID=UPI0011B65522|nr:phosphatase PAP2/dual specificity phosphatase family protein [Reyranella sp. CPCC 100927]TWT15755.1 phosphatase PAP2/dual specificity phosphatase family protein [Reyranella sp. CPCC 100927]